MSNTTDISDSNDSKGIYTTASALDASTRPAEEFAEIFDAICSEEFQTLIRVDAINGIRKFHPVYVLGYDSKMIQLMRSSYCAGVAAALAKQNNYRVGIYSVPSTEVLINRVGIAPSIMVLAPDVELVGIAHAFAKLNHVPVLRMLRSGHTARLVDLPNTDYYGGVYETVSEDAVSKSAIWTRVINIGLLVWLRTRGFRTADTTAISLRSTHAIRKSNLPKPEPSFTQFMRKQLERLGFDREPEALLASNALAESESSFDFGKDAEHITQTEQPHTEVGKKRGSWRTPVRHTDIKGFPVHNIVQPNY